MVQTSVTRSAMQLVFLCLVALLIFGAAPRAGTFDEECDEQAAACYDKCGTTTIPCTYNINNAEYWTCEFWLGSECVYAYYTGRWCYGDGVDYFECRPGEGKGYCMCSY